MRYFYFFILLAVIYSPLQAKPFTEADVPKPLKPWVKWVLYDESDRNCPYIYNNYAKKKCAWPGLLEISINDKRGRFQQEWEMFNSGWVVLPGNKKLWPKNITVNNKPVLVSEKNNLPVTYLKKGQYKVRGEFTWQNIPESLPIPADSGLLRLFIKGKAVKAPLFNKDAVWLSEQFETKQSIESDKLTIAIYRLLDDNLPMQVNTRIELQVSGAAREVNLGNVLLSKHIPVALSSRLPALLSKNGELRLQLKPGRWHVNIQSRAHSRMMTLGLNEKRSKYLPEYEIWAFKPQNHLRTVKLISENRLDPRQTNIPKAWQQFATFKVLHDSPLQLELIRRGDQTPQADSLKLRRDMWLDFDGKGYTVKDQITGTVTQSWRLEALPELELGQVTIDNVPQFITQLNERSLNKGIEIRRGRLNLSADSRYNENISSLLATGWDHNFKTVSSTLHLPPGWRVFSASGVDNVPQTWLQQWTLLDLFIVLIISISVYRLWTWYWGVFSLITMSLIWHEPGIVPQFIWLNLIAVIAIIRFLPTGRFKKICIGYRNTSFVVLLLIVIPFMVTQIRVAIYPQLEKSYMRIDAQDIATKEKRFRGAREDRLMQQGINSKQKMAETEQLAAPDANRPLSSGKLNSYITTKKTSSNMRHIYEPKSNVQTGPGLPVWKWNTLYLQWNGTVQKDQQINLVFISPGLHRLLNFFRAISVALLSLLILRSFLNFKIPGIPGLSRLIILLSLFPVLALNSTDSVAQSYSTPDEKILRQLKSRLTQPPECLPDCAQIESMLIRAENDTLLLKLNVHALQKVAIPLPVKDKQWLPSSIRIDGRKSATLFRAKDGIVWMKFLKGKYTLVLTGSIKSRQHIQLPLQLRPRFVQAKLKGWTIDGIQESGVPDSQLQLSRKMNEVIIDKKGFVQDSNVLLPPFLRIERTLKLGLEWFVDTRVTRVSPVGSAVVEKLPLLMGESIITDGVRSINGHALINMSAKQKQVFWRSRLKQKESLSLVAADNNFSTEIWRVNVSPLWHLEYQGIPVVKHINQKGRWLPQWHPWKGEEVKLNISRPKGTTGNTLTIDKSHLQVKPGKRAVESTLTLVLRSSQGGQYSLSLPDKAKVQSVRMNNIPLSIQAENKRITLPVTPGKQFVQIVWLNAGDIQSYFVTPKVNLNIESVNHSINVKFSHDRWVLFAGGPDLGPAVLFWGVLIVILIIAVGLGYTRVTPLNTLSWMLLGIGLSQVPVWMGMFVVGWLFLLATRKKIVSNLSPILFNTFQIVTGIITFIALSCLFVVIQQGLLGSPDMQVTGNGSSAFNFNWYQDRNLAELPQAWLLSVPTVIYRLLMLAWALWLAFSLLNWLKWGWKQFIVSDIWRDTKTVNKSATNEVSHESQSQKTLPSE